MQHAIDPQINLILSAKSGCRRQSYETSDARPGRWQAIEPSYYP
jgi:putative transposase